MLILGLTLWILTFLFCWSLCTVAARADQQIEKIWSLLQEGGMTDHDRDHDNVG